MLDSTSYKIEEVLKGYLEAALWSTVDHTPENEFLNENYEIEDIPPEFLVKCGKYVLKFINDNFNLFEQYCEERIHNPFQGSIESYFGHDLWMTTQGHGVGFWDRGMGELGDKFTELCQASDFPRDYELIEALGAY